MSVYVEIGESAELEIKIIDPDTENLMSINQSFMGSVLRGDSDDESSGDGSAFCGDSSQRRQ